ncbi:hypothetical protein GDO81_024765 [Engystomops pustulosus]|uniref:G-protein coupled receptors family 1 profile domain-containing protein n=1 Tax=Engystomops pustulosus TaxID=76066 RepID=A0AAV6ZPT7_ENGPU|nr:hypothetical protein GDO81_024765 [Engystomops pustulosus]
MMAEYEYPDQPSKIEDTHSNGPSDHDALLKLFLPVAYSITCVLGLIGNVLIIIVFVFFEKVKTLTDTFLMNLAIADILFLHTLPFLAYESAESWIFGDALCKIIRGTYRVNLYTSMLTLTAITVDRFISITQVTKANKYQVTKHKWRYGVCALLWVLALILALPQFIYNRVNESKACFEVYYAPIMELVVASAQMTVGLALPLISMVFCYSFILRTLVKARGVQKKKSMKIIVAIVVIFIVTQLPHNALVMAITLNKKLFFNPIFIRGSIVMEALAYIHACLNPILYFFVGTKFRKHFWRIFRCLGRHKMQEETTDPLRGTEGDSKNLSATTNICATSV